MSDKRKRQLHIRTLLTQQVVSSQEQLVNLLADLQIDVTQATLSRDLRDMGVERRRVEDGVRYVLDPKARYLKMLRQVVGMEIQGVRHNGSLVVVRTLAGRAEGVAGFLDGRGHANVLGTVAGDDTVLVVPADISLCDELVADILELAASDKEL